MNKFTRYFLITGIAAAIASGAAVNATIVMQVDLNTGNGTYSGTGPYIAGTTWNGIGVADESSSGYVNANGSSIGAGTVNFDFGDSVGAPGAAISWSRSLANGSDVNNAGGAVGTFYNSALMRDWNRSSDQNSDVGLRISGLPTGTYDLYLISRIADRPTDDYKFGVDVLSSGAAGSAFAIGSLANQLTLNHGAVTTEAGMGSDFILGYNYTKTTVTITNSSDYLTIIHQYLNGGSETGFYAGFQGFQLVEQTVAVPEPSTVLLVGLGGLMIWRLRRSRRQA